MLNIFSIWIFIEDIIRILDFLGSRFFFTYKKKRFVLYIL